MKTPLRMTLLPLVIGAFVAACSGGATPVDPEASSARDVDGGLVLHETTHGAINVGKRSGGATPVDPRVSSARDVHGGLLPPVSTNGAGEGRVHPFDVGTCSCSDCNNTGANCLRNCNGAVCPSSFGLGVSVGTVSYNPALFTTAAPNFRIASSSDSATRGSGGSIANPIIQLVFWGSQWSTASPTTGQVAAAISTVVQNSDYFLGLNQYGVSSVTLQWTIYNTDLTADPGYYGDPPATYAMSDVQAMVDHEISNAYLPADPNGYDTIYLVIMPPGTTPPSGTCGSNGQKGWPHSVAYVAFQSLDNITMAATHELVEAITDPQGAGWLMDQFFNSGYEIGDACNRVGAFVAGVRVQSYWSNSDKACIIPWASCGAEGQACCIGGLGDLASSCPSVCTSAYDVCTNGICQKPCGGQGQPCCAPSNTCATGATCQPDGLCWFLPGCTSSTSCAGVTYGFPMMTITCPNPVDFWEFVNTSNQTKAVSGATSLTLQTDDLNYQTVDACATNSAPGGDCTTFSTYVPASASCGSPPPPPPPPNTCNGYKKPTSSCSAGWHCCDSWTCGLCQ
jgi:hypothetical protein